MSRVGRVAAKAGKACWIGLDIGSGSARALLLDQRGRMRLAAREPLRSRRDGAGRVLYDPEAILRAAGRCLRRAAARAPRGALRAVGLAAQRSTFLLWRRRDGRPLTPAFGWQSRDGVAPGSPAAARRVARLTGLRFNPHYAGPRLAALLAREPRLRRALHSGEACFGTLDSFLIFRWTRGLHFRTDPTHAQRTLLYSLRRRAWESSLLRMFGAPRRALATIGPSTGFHLPLPGIGIPLTASCGDQQAALVAARSVAPGACLVNYGTGAFVLSAQPPGCRPPRGFLRTEALQPAGARAAAVEAPIPTAAAAFALLTPSRSRHTDAARPGSRTVLVAATNGIGAPFWLEDVPSLMLFDRPPGPAEAAAAAEASIAAAVQAALDRLQPPPSRLIAGGGLSERDGLLTLQADLSGRRVERARLPEWTALGAALLAAGRQRPRRLRLQLESFRPDGRRRRQALASYQWWRRAVRFLASGARRPSGEKGVYRR